MLSNNTRACYLFLLCCVALACGEQEGQSVSVIPQDLDVSVRDVLVIGADESASQEYLFGWPRFVVTDSLGRIYVADEAVMNVRVYDAAGHYLHTIGQRGQGPGEFQGFRGMTINEQGELIVLDRKNARFTRFASDGAVLATYPTQITAVSQIRQFGAQYLMLSNQESWEESDAYLFRLYKPDFREERVAFSRLSEVSSSAELIDKMILSVMPGSFAFLEGGVLYAPSIYEGKLHFYSEEQGQWQQIKQFLGRVEKKAYTEVVDEPMDKDHADAVLRYAGRTMAALLHNSSKGLFRLQDGRIVHFTFCEFGNERVFGVEVFDEDGSLTGYGAIRKVPLTAHGTASLLVDVVWRDDQDHFYLIDREVNPVIRVVELELGASTEVAGNTNR